VGNRCPYADQTGLGEMKKEICRSVSTELNGHRARPAPSRKNCLKIEVHFIAEAHGCGFQ
jgi:hypothetical protein